jgi:hypothetical protein
MLNTSSTTRKNFLMLAGVFILSLAVRLALISKGPYNLDTLNLVIQSQKTIETGILQHLFGTGYPLTVLLGALFILAGKIFAVPDPVFAVNLMSVVLSSGGVALLYRMTEECFGRLPAVLAAVSLSLCPIFLALSVYGNTHAPAIFFLLSGVLFFRRFLKNNRGRDMIVSAVFFGAMGAARLQDLALVFPAMCFGVMFGQPVGTGLPRSSLKSRLKALAAFFLIAAATAGAFHLPYIFQNNQEYGVNLWRFWQAGFQDKYMGILSPRLLVAGKHLADNFTWLGLMISFAGLLLTGRKNMSLGIFLLFWIAGPLVFYGNHRFIINPRFLSVILPPLAIGQGYLTAEVIRKYPLARLALIPVFVLMIFLPCLRGYPALKFRHEHALLPDFVRWVAASVEPGARVIAADEALFYKYYTPCRVLYRPADVLRAAPEDLARFKDTVDALLDQQIPVYITTASLYAYDRDRHFSGFFKSQYDGERVGSHYYEDWHMGSARTQVFLFDLYRVRKAAGAAGQSD